jgi:hypothetical protein
MSKARAATADLSNSAKFCTAILSFSTACPGKATPDGRFKWRRKLPMTGNMATGSISYLLQSDDVCESKPLTKISLGLKYATFSACGISS